MEANPSKAEAERLLGVSEKLLQNRDLLGARDFALLAQETEPLLDGSDQILAVIDVLLVADKRINNHLDWYSILELDRRSDDLDLIRKQYRRLALLLHPDKNNYAFADHAFKIVGNAWAVFSDPSRKPLFDKEHGLFTKIDLSQQSKLLVRRTQPRYSTNSGVRNDGFLQDATQRLKMQSFWTTCPYCYIIYEYPRIYKDSCVRCQKCERAFHASEIQSLPPLVVEGQDAYYCCWGFFPLGYMFGSSANGRKVVRSTPAPAPAPATAPVPAARAPTPVPAARAPTPVPTPTPPGFPNWMPAFSTPQSEKSVQNNTPMVGTQRRDGFVDVSVGDASQFRFVPRKRGRPRKQR